ncbi:MAG: hypothetical protein G01um101418_225 [Parcubacteria group bacterium Gr01-1014_18]|nr:MAG: hypothetical protein Greene041636_193 [Parcubacteria group bacterium Greene0416_36]TSC81385.1 MAG: hypothetical protein G01um101418_225 [Parcubacteria group bacterium Gr01-1014_18]TSC99429.1 MAG: hypothetical protein Greene101420_96 [Parcubacteria group bacterium Greene1014_20]TSD07652.1 MAG: hypothetical protein Greene07142_109 [Parcubacteria group bacterium Greene0714_2]
MAKNIILALIAVAVIGGGIYYATSRNDGYTSKWEKKDKLPVNGGNKDDVRKMEEQKMLESCMALYGSGKVDPSSMKGCQDYCKTMIEGGTRMDAQKTEMCASMMKGFEGSSAATPASESELLLQDNLDESLDSLKILEQVGS